MNNPPHETGIHDSLGHEISPQELNPRYKETCEMLELLHENPLTILTSESNCYGKSTLARMLRHRLNAETDEPERPKCVYQDISSYRLPNKGRRMAYSGMRPPTKRWRHGHAGYEHAGYQRRESGGLAG